MEVFAEGAYPDDETRSAVTIGVYDGVHVGHRHVLRRLCETAAARGLRSAVVTFDPHPASIVAPERAPLLLTSVERRLELLAALGIDRCVVVGFDESVATEPPASFVERVLVDELHAAVVVVGEDFRFGHDRLGDVALLSSVGTRRGFVVDATPIYGDSERWSSTAVRSALLRDDVHTANAYLGRPFVLRGVIEHGDARGARLGFPTANVATQPRQQLPGLGIYAGAARPSGGDWHAAAISVGTRPQFYEAGAVLVEAYLIDYSGDLYDATVDVAFLSPLRGEMTFKSVNKLIRQIEYDVAQTTEIFRDFSPMSSALLR